MVIQGATRWAHDVTHAIAPTRVRYCKADDDAGYHELSAIGAKQPFCACGLVSAFGVKADINSGTMPALGSYEGGGYERRQDEGR